MDWVLAIPALPAAAFAVMAPLSRRARNAARWISVVAMCAALALSLLAFSRVWPGVGVPESSAGAEAAATAEGHAPEEPAEGASELVHLVDPEPVWRHRTTLATIGEARFGLGFKLDPTTAAMLVMVTLVGSMVQIYSIGYMHRDERIGWYFAVLSLFSAAMLGVVMADNYLMLYAMWEIMGLCSYLLIGFWHEQEAPRRAAVKAFLTTRIGDVGFALGLAVIFVNAGSFDFDVVFATLPNWAGGAALAAALLLLAGAMGKSAQVPLHVWLPDAMAGPTPASALIHAATMVAAGVYLVARSLPIFAADPLALQVTLVVGVTTALVGGSLAMVQHDIKKVLAYSTISQLGYMFAALGSGAYVAALFHLVTHAFFKSLLFLGAGVIIHATHTQDMREMGGLARKMPWTTGVFTVGALALAGMFPLAGFFSKDEVLASLWHGGHYVAFALALATAGITAFYVARLMFRVFAGYLRTPEAREGHPEIIGPMVVLALITLVAGWGVVAFAGFLGHEGEWPQPQFYLPSLASAGLGLAAGWWAYGRRSAVLNTSWLKHRLSHAYDMLAQKLYFDMTYDVLLVRPFIEAADRLARFDLKVIDGVVNGAASAWRALADASARFDLSVVDGAVNGLASGVRAAGGHLRRLQTGRVQTYQKLIVGALVLLMLWIVVKGA
ncbi:MAG: NADH-quinone oxidoreductase subunit L [Coriobacteriaceae bacterium]|nr:NADH-quinone oxidoreductase subunit L [Coriobacteriaceae bacterium]